MTKQVPTKQLFILIIACQLQSSFVFAQESEPPLPTMCKAESSAQLLSLVTENKPEELDITSRQYDYFLGTQNEDLLVGTLTTATPVDETLVKPLSIQLHQTISLPKNEKSIGLSGLTAAQREKVLGRSKVLTEKAEACHIQRYLNYGEKAPQIDFVDQLRLQFEEAEHSTETHKTTVTFKVLDRHFTIPQSLDHVRVVCEVRANHPRLAALKLDENSPEFREQLLKSMKASDLFGKHPLKIQCDQIIVIENKTYDSADTDKKSATL